MKLMIIRHGDPDYAIDSLTQKGWKEAELLAEKMMKVPMDAIYMSPLGRAKDTASLTLQKTGKKAKILDWLQEFYVPVKDEEDPRVHIPWDFMPARWTKVPVYYDKDHWTETKVMKSGAVDERLDAVVTGLDGLLKKHGYERDGAVYRAICPNTDTVVLFCHFGVECVMLSHLLGISPVVLWHGFCAAPTSVTTLVTEEREKGIAYFRMSSFGDISHLYAGGEEPAFAARFCEVYDDMSQRH